MGLSSAFRPRFSVFQLGAKMGFYLLSGVLGETVVGGVGGVGGVGATNCDSPPLVETGMSLQSNEYTNSPFAVFPIGKHFTGSPTLSAGGAGARFGVCANAGDVISTSARTTSFIPMSPLVMRALNRGKSDPAIVPARKRAKSYRIVPIGRGDP